MQPKVQHYVPQVYLRNFATLRKKEFFVWCFDKVTHKAFKSNVKNVAAQTSFYDFVTHEGVKTSIESFFNEAETTIKYAIDALNEQPTISTVLNIKQTLAKFFALQELRTVVFRDTHDHMIHLANQQLRIDGLVFQTPTEDITKEFQARFLVDKADIFTNTLLKMKWILVFNQTSTPFWTSDNPIARYNPHKSDIVGNLGWENPGIQLHIPISPNLAIIICDPVEYADIASELPAVATNVDFNNSGQVINSRQYLFSPNHNFDLAQDMIRKDPKLSNPKRPRITTAS